MQEFYKHSEDLWECFLEKGKEREKREIRHGTINSGVSDGKGFNSS